MADRLSQDDSDFSDNEDDDSLTDAPPANNAQIMSLFASYYGIENPTKDNEGPAPKGTIDDANFAAEDHVKELLQTENLEGLIVKDAEMVHEIRTLDGEMQKLVYDNYNKFITATETIKEMKKDVDNMDQDMSSVREKMEKITGASKHLDGLLEDKRQKVDKLVRVRRLLERLEFLSELPERLAAMIDNKHYIDAVKLYNKTITVLTRHSHVLSFKKIKERTELMMADLTEKVIDMLDDSSLEAIKLTQFVSVLRLMNAPREKVFKKFLSAHQRRAQKITSQFNEALNAGGSSFDVAEARQYHQSVLVSLIEACKGINELYNGFQVESKNMSVNDQLSQTSQEFYQTIQQILKEYSKALRRGFNKFFGVYYSHFQKNENGLIDFSTLQEEELVFLSQEFKVSNSGNQTASVGAENTNSDISINRFSLSEQRNSWLLLARQSILDVKYLDSSFVETCSLFQKLIGSGHNLKVQTESFYSSFSEGILDEIQHHNNSMRKLIIHTYVQNILVWIPKFVTVLEFSSSSAPPSLGAERSHSSSSLSSTIPTGDDGNLTSQPKTLLQKKAQAVQCMMNLMSVHTAETFTECAVYIKPLVEIYEVINLDPITLCKSLITDFSYHLSQEIEVVCGINRQNTGHLISTQTNDGDDHEISESQEYEVDYDKLNEYDNSPSYNSGKENPLFKKNLLFYFACILKFCSSQLPTIFDEELSSHEFPPIENMNLEKNISRRVLQNSFQTLFLLYLEFSTRNTAEFLSNAFLEHFLQNPRGTVDNHSNNNVKSVTISSHLISYLEYLDQIAINSYLLLNEQPPHLKSSTHLERELIRRTANTRSSIAMGNNNLALQMDIERLFSQQVKIFTPMQPNSGTEYLIGTILKASIKAVQEELRNTCLVHEAYVQIRIELTFLKGIAPYVLKEVAEIESLVDLALSTIFSRYLGANDIAAATDTSEVGLMTKAHGEAFAILHERTSLFSKSR